MASFPRVDPASSRPPARGVDTHELANALTHGIGAMVALVAGLVLVALAATRGDGWQLLGASVFATCLFLLYLASTLYHSAVEPLTKSRLKVFDHCAIYLLIAGTYTPFTLVGLRGELGWQLFAGIWTLALAGVCFKLFFTGRFKRLSTAIYIAMGWAAIIAIRPLLDAVDTATLGWLLAGGLAYTGGTVFYLGSSRYSHAVWHVFCVIGSTCHYVAVLRHVA